MKNDTVKANCVRMRKHIDAVLKMDEGQVDVLVQKELPGAKLTGNLNEKQAWLLKTYLDDIFWLKI